MALAAGPPPSPPPAAGGGEEDHHVAAQKKTFAKWLNSVLEGEGPAVTDLFFDLRDGLALLAALERLTGRRLRRERGSLRVHRLSNVAAALSVLREERVKLVNVHNVDVVDGNPKITLALVWAIILHWQMDRVLGDDFKRQRSSGLERCLLAWCRQWTRLPAYSHLGVDVRDFSASWSDGLSLCCLLHAHCPQVIDLDRVASTSPAQRLEMGFSAAEEHVGVPRLLDAEDLLRRPDKKSVMTYVMCLFQALPHENIDLSALDDLASASSSVLAPDNLIGSPLKTPIKNLTKGNPLTYDLFCSIHEDVLEWLLDCEDKLSAMAAASEGDESKSRLAVVREQYQGNRAFLREVEAQDNSVGEVQREGKLLLETELTPEQSADVRLRMKLLLERWSSFRQSALDRQSEIDNALMELQGTELASIKDWMTTAEDKISRLGQIGSTRDEVERQMRDHRALKKDFEEREALISDFIYVDSVGGGDGSAPHQDLEVHVMAMEERWCVLCGWIEERGRALHEAAELWRSLLHESAQLSLWMDGAESTVKKMEQSPTEEKTQLLQQVKQILEIEAEMDPQRRRMEALEATGERMLGLIARPEGGSGDDGDDGRAPAKDNVVKFLEAVQDRWEILTEVMEAQRQRLHSLGQSLTAPFGADSSDSDLPKISAASEEAKTASSCSSASTATTSASTSCSTDSPRTARRRKATAEKRIQFETAFARASAWLQDTEKQLENPPGLAYKDAAAGKSDAPLDACDALLRESGGGPCREALKLGRELIAEILSEPDFPPDYLANARDKVQRLEGGLEAVGRGRQRLQDKVVFLRGKRDFYARLEALIDRLGALEEGTAVAGEGVALEAAGAERLGALADDVGKRLADTRRVIQAELPVVKKLAGEVSLLPGAFVDPTNRVKEDVYNFCDKWEALEAKLVRQEAQIGAKLKQLQSAQERSGSKMSAREKELLARLDATAVINRVSVMRSDMDRLRSYRPWMDIGPDVKAQLEERLNSMDRDISQIESFRQELDGLFVWMNEVETFLGAEDAAFGDLDTLDAQLKESDALQGDIETLKPNVTVIRETGQSLKRRCARSCVGELFDDPLLKMEAQWSKTVEAAKRQNEKLVRSRDDSLKATRGLDDLHAFLSQLQSQMPPTEAVSRASELSQRTYKLMELKDALERRRKDIEDLEVLVKQSRRREAVVEENPCEEALATVTRTWKEVCEAVTERYAACKATTAEYGEFKTLCAQESDWLERLDKKLRKGGGDAVHTAADAEEISEELDDIENFLNNHPEERLVRLMELARSLEARKLLDSSSAAAASPTDEAQRLRERWLELAMKAKQRTDVLEGSMAEAQEWEYKLIEVQDWLAEKDLLLTTHLEQELCINDLPDESQKMLREFEDQENLLSEMDEQVDAYRESGKAEAAARLEDQLHLIHQRFQELLMKFELFQRQPAVDYEPRLARVHRQLRDIREKARGAELAAAEPDGVRAQLADARCVYNALSDIKPEVENVIKMGRKIVLSEEEVVEDRRLLTEKIDSLKEEFNEIGAQITEAKKVLERALRLSEDFRAAQNEIVSWLDTTEEQLEAPASEKLLKEKFADVSRLRERVKGMQGLLQEFYELSAQAPLVLLKDALSDIESRWSVVVDRLQAGAKESDKTSLDFAAAGRLSPTSSPMLEEFRAALKSFDAWVDSAEARLADDAGQSPAELSMQIDRRKTKLSEIRSLSEKLLLTPSMPKDGVSADMERLNRRWDKVVKRVEEKLIRRPGSPAKEITRAELASPLTLSSPSPTSTTTAPQAIADLDEEVIDTLPEDGNAVEPPKANSHSGKSRVKSQQDGGDDEDGDEHTVANSSLLSSRESSPDLEVVTGTIILKSNSPTFIKETVSKIPRNKQPAPPSNLTFATPSRNHAGNGSPVKTPPKTLPKPKWFTLPTDGGKAQQQKPKISPAKVKVVCNTLPSPAKASQKTEKRKSAEEGGSDVDDEFLAKENSAIERILSEATSELAEVKRRAGYTPSRNSVNSDYHQRVVKDFESSVEGMLPKLARAKEKMVQLELEPDLRLRRDLLSMEAKVVEAEVATLVSRGETLVLFTQRADSALAERLQSKVATLSQTWKDLNGYVEEKKKEALQCEEDLSSFQRRLEDLVAWIADAHERCSAGMGNDGERVDGASLAREVRSKKEEVRAINNLAASIKSRQLSLGTNSMVLAIANAQWEKLLGRIRIQREVEALSDVSDNEASTNSPNAPTVTASDAGEVLARIAKMREAVAAVERQLKTQILASKLYENLPEQAEALETCKSALETLRPTIKKTAKDLEELTGSLSVEYLEKIVAFSERLRDEWQLVNKRFSDRHAVWSQCKQKHDSYQKKRKELENWLERAENVLLHSSTQPSSAASNDEGGAKLCSQEHIQLERQVSEKNKEVTSLAVLGKEIMHQTSAQEHVEIQTHIDRILKRWKFVLSQLATHRERMNREKYVNNVNYMNHWLEQNLARVNQASFNVSDSTSLMDAIKMVKDYDRPLVEKQKQMDKLLSSSAALSSDVAQKLKNKHELFIATLNRRKTSCESAAADLNSLKSKIATATVWCDHTASIIHDATRRSSSPEMLRAESMVAQKEPEIAAVFAHYEEVKKDVAAKQLDVNIALRDSVDALTVKWQGLCTARRRQEDQLETAALNSTTAVYSKIDKRKKRDKEKCLAAPNSAAATNGNVGEEEEERGGRRGHENGDSPLELRAPQIYAALRDHRDWVGRKRRQLSALRLAGDADSVQKQAREHAELRSQIDAQRIPVTQDVDLGKSLGNSSKDIRECLGNLETEWRELCDQSEAWKNQVDNALANMKIFEAGLLSVESRVSEMESSHAAWSHGSAPPHRASSSSVQLDQEHLQRLSVQIAALEQNMAEIRAQAARLPSLSQATLIQLDKVGQRLRALRRDVDRQQSARVATTNGHRDDVAGGGDDDNARFNEALPDGWERGVTRERIPYYLNHADESTQWDHPQYSELMCRLLEVNTVRYSAYRLALKLRRVQQRLCLDLLDLETALFAFDEHGLTADRHDLAIQVPEIVLVLSHVYQALQQEEPESVASVPLCVDLCLNWLLNVYDGARVGQIRVLSFKLGVLLLCRGPLTEKYLHLFKLVASNRRLTPRQLGLLLFDSIQVPKVLGEVASFGGSNVEPSVRSCFALGVREGGEPHLTVDAKHFLRWLRQEPQSMVWLPVLHRLAAAETARHNVRCKVCKMQPIVGFRYHCLKCFSFDLCNNCFFLGKSAKGHKPEHPMQEYCTSTGTSVNLKNLGQAFRNSFRSKKYFKKKQQKLGYLPVASPLEGPDLSSPPSLSPNLSAESRDLHGSQNDSLNPKIINPDSSTPVPTKIDEPSGRRIAAPLTNLKGKDGTDDEHAVIAKFCRRLNDIEGLSDTDTDNNAGSSLPRKKKDLERMIEQLEDENRSLGDEYERLKAARLRQDAEGGDAKDEEQEEARELLQRSSRMEAKMRILEEHNQQLESQIGRLRQLLEEEHGVSANDEGVSSPTQLLSPAQQRHFHSDSLSKNFGTLQAKSVVATLLQTDAPEQGGGEASIRRRRDPPRKGAAGRDKDDSDSLDLSDREDLPRVAD